MLLCLAVLLPVVLRAEAMGPMGQMGLMGFAMSHESHSSPADLSTLFRLSDYEALIRAYEAAPSAAPRDRAYYAIALERTAQTFRAAEVRARLKEEHPNDVWTRYAELSHRINPSASETKIVLDLAGDTPPDDIVRMHAFALFRVQPETALAFVDRYAQTPALRSTRMKLRLMEARSNAEAMGKIANEASTVEELIEAAQHLQMMRQTEASYELAAKAAEKTESLIAHRLYWTAAQGKNEEIAADVATLLEQRDWPEVWVAAAKQYAQMGRKEDAEKLRDRVLREAPQSIHAQFVLRDLYHENRTRENVLAAMRHPHQPEPLLQQQAAATLFRLAATDAEISNDVLLEAIRLMVPMGPQDVRTVHIAAPLEMMKRKLDLKEAERIARAGFASAKEAAERFRAFDVKRAEEALQSNTALLHDTLGQLLLEQGRAEEATKELLAARALDDESPAILLHLAQAHEATGALDKAETLYQEALAIEPLKALYQKRHKTLAGWESYLAGVKDKDSAARRKKALATRANAPRNTPPFTLKTLDGNTVSLADLKGKVVVINFWGVWCGWCVKEMPEFVELVAKYARDKRVAIVTINNDPNVETPRKWMASKKYAFPVLLNDGYADRHVRSYPTTWFLDKEGRIAFELVGATHKLVEEFSWRIDALR